MLNAFTIGIIVVAYSFDFFNGFHDAANSITTVIATRVLSPFAAVSMAAFFNFVAFLIFGVAVAKTIGSGIVTPAIIDENVILGALVGAIAWDIITWYVGLPTSSSHALIGGLIGAGVMNAVDCGLMRGNCSCIFTHPASRRLIYHDTKNEDFQFLLSLRPYPL